MQIRNASQEERPLIRQQRIKAYQIHTESINAAHWQALKQAISSEADSGPGVELLVAELEGEIVGSVALFPPDTDAYEGYVDKLDYPEIRMLAVAPKAQGTGVASALIKECIKRAEEKGYSYIGLHTGEFMEKAISLYERHGFKRLPQYDFEPANDGITVKAFRRSL